MLHNRHGEVENIGLLEGILAKHAAHALAGDDDHRHGIHVGSHDAGDGVRRAGAAGNQYRGRFAGGARIAIGFVRRVLLVAGQHELDLALQLIQRIKQRNGRAAWQTEHNFDSGLLQALQERFRANHLFFTHFLPPI